MNKQLTAIVLSHYFVQISFIFPIIVIPLGFEPKTHSLEGCCSNPTELRNQHFSKRKLANQQRNQPLFLFAAAKVHIFFEYTKLFLTFFFFLCLNIAKNNYLCIR